MSQDHSISQRASQALKRIAVLSAGALLISGAAHVRAEGLPIFDAHVHYSHDSVEMTPPERVIELMREANLKGALVSSSDDKGTQLLANLAPDLVIPGLRPYRKRGELGTWFNDPGALEYVRSRLEKHRYASIGEFHLYGEDADTPIAKEIVRLAGKHNLVLHAHSDADAVDRLFAQDPTAKILWAHAGFVSPAEVGKMLEKYNNLWADLAFRSDMGYNGKVDPEWKALFERFPNRIMLGTDTFTPERIYYIPEHAAASRSWLKALPENLAERLAWRNAVELLAPIWKANRSEKKASATAQPVASACQSSDPSQTFRDDQARVVVQVDPAVKVSEPFSITATVCDLPDTATVSGMRFDATMPRHGHGMNYRPQAVAVENTARPTYRIEGVVLHMPGEWQWAFDLQTSVGKISLAQNLVLE